ncbi:MAG: cupin domain-containing protein [Patescibacteria group bacterium UBA2103]
MKGYVANIEKETLENEDYRRVLYTTKHSQLVLMAIQAGDEIGEETHHLDQFIRLEQGSGKVIIDGVEHEVEDDFAFIIPAGACHNVINTGKEVMKLYSLYMPPEHKHGTVHKTKAEETHEHFDGETSE